MCLCLEIVFAFLCLSVVKRWWLKRSISCVLICQPPSLPINRTFSLIDISKAHECVSSRSVSSALSKHFISHPLPCHSLLVILQIVCAAGLEESERKLCTMVQSIRCLGGGWRWWCCYQERCSMCSHSCLATTIPPPPCLACIVHMLYRSLQSLSCCLLLSSRHFCSPLGCYVVECAHTVH